MVSLPVSHTELNLRFVSIVVFYSESICFPAMTITYLASLLFLFNFVTAQQIYDIVRSFTYLFIHHD